MKDIIIFLFSIILFSSCIAIDHKPLGYWIHNNTEDTLLIDMTESDTLNGGAQWFFSPTDTLLLDKDDTVSVCIHGKRKIFLDLITSCHIQNQVQFILYLIRAICM